MKGAFDADGELVAAPDRRPFGGRVRGHGGRSERLYPRPGDANLPTHEDFESFTLTETNRADGALFAYPPLPWIGARFKFEVREKDGTKVLAKTTDNKFFQRATVFIGTPEMSHYTIQADVMSDGNRRKMSEVGIINQHYLIVLKGNEQKLEVNSNQERLRVRRRISSGHRTSGIGSRRGWMPTPDGSAVVRAKAWKRDEPEPDAMDHRSAAQDRAPGRLPGLFGFSPQDMRGVYRQCGGHAQRDPRS